MALLVALLAADFAFAQEDFQTALSSSPSQIRSAARASFVADDTAKGCEHLALLLELYRRVGEADQTPLGRYQWSSRLTEVAYEYLRAGELPEAMKLLGQVADLNVQPRNEVDNGLAPTAGALFRRLVALDSEERFELLYAWSMPTDSRRTVREVASIVPNDSPPSVFARTLGERPRRQSFEVASVGIVSGLFSSAWILVESAAQCGRLRQLTTELDALAGEDVPNAAYVLTLAEILRDQPDAGLARELGARAAQVAAGIQKPGPSQVDLKQLVTAAACLGKKSMTSVGESMLLSLIEYTYGAESFRMRAFLRVAYATAVRNRLVDSSSELRDEPMLTLWRPWQATTSRLNAMGCVPAMWLAHEDHILHLAGPDNSLLFFRYPLTGDFEFSFETQDGGRRGTEGGVEYGGLGFEAWGGGRVFRARDADLVNIRDQPSPFVPATGHERFHRLAIKSTDAGFTVLSNGHPVWNDTSGNQASPWFGLRSFRDRRPVFRNFKLTGNPTIPREVRMSDGGVLRGWRASYYGQRLPSPFSATNPQTFSRYEWYLHDGIIYGSKRGVSSNQETRLTYARPLSNGESVSYEFHYKPGEFEVHPALGRLAFLIAPNGVRVHWMTGDREWTCLPEDNAVVEALNRRGPKPLPLLEDEWNRVSLALTDDKVTLSLNSTIVYERKMEPEIRPAFAFYRKRTKSARIRNVIMRGDWPERLSDDQLNNLTAASADRTISERRASHALIEETNIAANVFEVRKRASELTKEARFRYLFDWVMPGKDHPGFRLAGDFTPTNPPPTDYDDDAQTTLRLRTAVESRVHVGGNLMSPAFDLVDLAQELGLLDKLRDRIEKTKISENAGQEQRARSALLFLIDIARNEEDAAKAEFGRLFDLFRESDHHHASERWPETLAMSRGVHYSATRELMGEFLNLLNDMYNSNLRQWRTSSVPSWDNYFFSLLGAQKYYGSGQPSLVSFTAAPRLKNWSPVSYATSKTRGEGQPRPHWQLSDKRIDKMSGHEHDYLLFRIPLRGNYEVECDLTPFAWRNTQLMVGGTWVAPFSNRTSYDIGSFREQQPRRALEPKLGLTETFVRVRAVVRDGTCTTYYDGRKLHEESLPAEPEPWVAIRNLSRYHGAVRDVRIAGNPIIPEQINLGVLPDLPSWIPYFEDTVGPRGDWRHDGNGGIIGVLKPAFAGTLKESLLRYQRPMLEDGTIEYEFYYQRGRADVHPVLDRLAFMLEEEGVRVHWVTDGKYDRSGADPANRYSEPDNRRGPERLPLKAQDWNRLRLTLRGDTVSLELNGQLVYERDLEPTNQRTFGLFHYADQTESRVRNIIWRGDWPRELPSMGEQELADDTDFLDERLPELTAVFEHDFSRDGLPETYFRKYGPDFEQHISIAPDGVHVVRPSGETWVQAMIQTRFRARGDFDISAAFEQLETSAERQDTKTPLAASISLLAALSGEGKQHCKVIRREERNGRQVLVNQFAFTQPNGARRNFVEHRVYEAKSGRFRLARRGDQVYFLFADGDSPIFRVLGTETTTTEDTAVNGLQLTALARGTGRVSVVWKSLSIRAEQLMHTSDPEPPVLFVMSTDGKEVRQLTKPIGDLGSHASPAWSPDGERIAFDTFKDSTTGSHIFLINPDGSGLKDLGFGSMPTFSPDGKRIAFSWSGRGITIMDADGKNRKILDASGWGAQWSPDGKSIAYGSRNITILDLATKKKRTIFEGEQADRYGFIYWNMSWSRDGSQICFKGRTRTGGKYEVAIVDAAGSSNGFQVLYSGVSEPQTDFSWHPSGKQILCAMHEPAHGGQRLFTLDVEKPGPPTLLQTQPLDQKSTSPDWSPDGKYIVFSSQAPHKWKPLLEAAEVEGQKN